MSRRRRAVAIIVAALIVILAGAHLVSRPAPDHPFFTRLPGDRTLVIAHRGGALLFPENTIVAFRGAVELGADVLEMDVFQTSDGVPVVIHDRTVDRTTDGAGEVRAFTLEELQRLDAGHRFSRVDEPVEFPYRGEGVTIPTVREVFETFPREHMIVEIKENNTDLADAVLALVREFDRVDRTLIGSFHHDILAYVRDALPAVATHGSERELIPFLVASWLFLGGVMTPGYEAVLVPQRTGPIPVTTRRFIRATQGRNLFVAAWTINDPDEMRDLVARGVDALLTDRPDLAYDIVRR